MKLSIKLNIICIAFCGIAAAENQTTLLSFDQAVIGNYPANMHAGDHPAGFFRPNESSPTNLATYYGRVRDLYTGDLMSSFSRQEQHETESLVIGRTYSIELGIGNMVKWVESKGFTVCESTDCTKDYMVNSVNESNFKVMYLGDCINDFSKESSQQYITKIWKIQNNTIYNNFRYSRPEVSQVYLSEGQFAYMANQNYPEGTCTSIGLYMKRPDNTIIRECGQAIYNYAEGYYEWTGCITQPQLVAK